MRLRAVAVHDPPRAGPEVQRGDQGDRRARDHVRRYGAQPPPAYLRDAHYGGAAALGRGQGYEYPHDKPDGLSSQDVMPEEVGDVRFYDPRDREPALRARLDEVRRARGRD